MPVYLYKHPQTGVVKEVVQGMNDVHEFVDEFGVKYERVFLSPRTAVDTQVNAFDKESWMRRTRKSGITIGDMMDESSALSEQRAAKLGKDPIKEKVFNDYKESTGKPHPDSIPKRIETKDYVLER